MSATHMILLAATLTLAGVGCYATAGARWTAITAGTFFTIFGALWVGKAFL